MEITIKDWRIPDDLPTILTYLLAGEGKLETEEGQWLVEDYMLPYLIRVLDRFTANLAQVDIPEAEQLVILGCLKRALNEQPTRKEGEYGSNRYCNE